MKILGNKNRLFIGGLFFEIFLVVPRAGLEPAHPKAVDFESTASTNFATQASVNEVHYTDV